MLLQKIRKWFYNHYSPPERRYVKFIRRWSAQNTYYHMCRDEVMLEAQKMAGAPPGSQAFLGCLQDATTKLWKRLPPGNQQVYANLAKKWSDEFPPPNIQARYVSCPLYVCFSCLSHRMASSVSAKIIRNFQLQIFKTCGVRCIVMAAHMDKDGKVITILYVLRY